MNDISELFHCVSIPLALCCSWGEIHLTALTFAAHLEIVIFRDVYSLGKKSYLLHQH